MFNIPIAQWLIASVLLSALGVSGLLYGPTLVSPEAEMKLLPVSGTTAVGETFIVTIVVRSETPVNVFRGLLNFDEELLQITAIDYNTSVADLWAEEPWYSNGDGTVAFIGGTTIANGFVGEATLLTITFETLAVGEAHLTMDEVRILKHDGLGTDIPQTTPIDAIFAVSEESLISETVVNTQISGPSITVLSTIPNTDLNGDGKQTIADVSIFMTHFATQNLRSDFNEDGAVTLKDLSILSR